MDGKNVDLLATDTGYSYLKGAWREGGELKVDRIPSAVAQFRSHEAALEGSLAPDIHYRAHYYLAGERALNFPSNLISTYQEDFSVIYTPLLVYEFMKKHRIVPKKVCVSIALNEFDKEILCFDPKGGVKKGKKKELVKEYVKQFTINGETYEFEVSVFPQGVGIWIDMESPENAVIVDIGDRTIDLVFVRGGMITGAGFTTGFSNEGTMKIANSLARSVKELTGVPVDILKAKMWLEKDKIVHGGKEIDLRPIKQEIGIQYVREVISKLTSRPEVKDFVETYGKVIFAGGGARFVPEEVKQFYGIEVPPEPEFSNVRGFLKAMEGEEEVR